MPKILVHHIYPPIPIRSFDYQATYEGDEPDDDGHMAVGHGATADDAIAELTENYPRGD